MRVISKIKRPNGHAVTLDGETYAFRPPEYAANVSEPAHIARFRQIPEGYVLTEPPKAPAKPNRKPASVSRMPSAPDGDGA